MEENHFEKNKDRPPLVRSISIVLLQKFVHFTLTVSSGHQARTVLCYLFIHMLHNMQILSIWEETKVDTYWEWFNNLIISVHAYALLSNRYRLFDWKPTI